MQVFVFLVETNNILSPNINASEISGTLKQIQKDIPLQLIVSFSSGIRYSKSTEKRIANIFPCIYISSCIL